MAKRVRHQPPRSAIRQCPLECLPQGFTDLQGYDRVLVVFCWRTAVVTTAWLPVHRGCVSLSQLNDVSPKAAWPVWRLIFDRPPAAVPPLPSASVVVCTRDRTDDLDRCLQSLSHVLSQGYEVIVVDNCPSTERTAQLMSRYPRIRYLRELRSGLNVARNTGLSAATGEIVAFTDDDAQVDSGWLSALLRNFDDPMVTAVTGLTLPLELETEPQQWFERTNSFARGFVSRQFDLTKAGVFAAGQVGAGVNMALRRRSLEEIGVFDEALDCGTPARSGGDQEFFYRVLARGHRIVYEPQALVWHRHRREWRALRRTLYGYGVGVFAWWTRCLWVERELGLLWIAPRWFFRHHVWNVLRALLRRPQHLPLDLALAGLFGALAGPCNFFRSRRRVRRQSPAASRAPAVGSPQGHADSPVPAPGTLAGQDLSAP